MISPLKLARMNAGLKQYRLAGLLGISQAELSNYELSRYRMPMELRYKTAKLLETPVETLFPEQV